MNKKFIFLIVLLICIILVFLLIYRRIEKIKNIENNNINENELSETTFEDNDGEKYTVIYSEANLVYEIYDENGNLVGISPTESGVYEYIENPDLMKSIQ